MKAPPVQPCNHIVTFIGKSELNFIIPVLWGASTARVLFPENMDQGHYDVTAHIPLEDYDLVRVR